MADLYAVLSTQPAKTLLFELENQLAPWAPVYRQAPWHKLRAPVQVILTPRPLRRNIPTRPFMHQAGSITPFESNQAQPPGAGQRTTSSRCSSDSLELELPGDEMSSFSWLLSGFSSSIRLMAPLMPTLSSRILRLHAVPGLIDMVILFLSVPSSTGMMAWLPPCGQHREQSKHYHRQFRHTATNQASGCT